MTKKLFSKKMMAAFLALGLTGLLALPMIVSADLKTDIGEYGLEEKGTLGNVVGLGKRDVRSTVGNIINIVLGILGIIAVVLILAGGFKWMTAGGNEDKVGEAKKMITQGVVGLVIVFAAWGIASFVVENLSKASQTGTGT